MIGSVPGDSARERAERLAGALAELGVRRLVLRSPDGRERTLEARRTDLPGLLLGPGSTLVCDELGLEVAVTREGLRWSSRDPATAASLAERLNG